MTKVLALFDGMSCGKLAFERAGIPVTQYLASEIDKYAIQIAHKNHPGIIQLGDVKAARRAAEAGVFGEVDYLIGGSPCQGFSFAGKQLAFDDPRSALFFEYVKTLEALRRDNPDIKFLLENVRMKKDYLDIISETLGVEPICINSALVSAQNRVRYYWCNWHVEQPEDRGIYLRDIIESGIVDNEHIISGGQLKRLKESTDLEKGFSKINPDKAACMTARQYANWKDNFITLPVEKKRAIAGISVTKNGFRPYKKDGAMGSLSEIGTIGTPDTKSACINSTHAPKFTSATGCIRVGTAGDIKGHDYNRRVYSPDGESPSLAAASGGNLEPKVAIYPWEEEHKVTGGRVVGRKINPKTGRRDDYNPDLTAEQRVEPRKDDKAGCITTVQKDSVLTDGISYRKLTPIECERLQTLPDNYTEGVSNTQRYKMIGNGWTVDVIAHLLRYSKNC